MRILPFLLLISPAIAQTAGADQTGSVTGVVTDAITHIPVKKTMVTANPTSNMGGGHNQGMASAVTDAAGAFTLTNLQAGQYRLMFVQQSYPQARFGGVAKTVDVKAGESAGPVNVELIPGASISGHIVDEDGDPLQNCYVQIHSLKNPDQGVSILGSSSSDRDGVYRVFGIAAGKYTLSTQCGQSVFQPHPFSSGPAPPPTRAYPMLYYPSTTELKSAQPVELTAGNEKSGLDFQMVPTPVTQVHGFFSPAGADWHGGQLILQLMPVTEHGINRNLNMAGSHDQQKGTFEFRQVYPGSYLLCAFSQGQGDNRVGAFQKIDVGDKPLEVVLELHNSADLTGKLEIESSSNTANKLTPGQINLALMPQGQYGLPGANAQVAADGTFALKAVLPARWHLQLNGPMAFIKQAWLGSTEVTGGDLDLTTGAAGSLRILVSTNTASIRGSAPAGRTVMLQSVEQNPLRAQQVTGVNANGQYNFGGLAPGKYRLILTEMGGPMSDDGGQEITVREGETVMVDLKP